MKDSQMHGLQAAIFLAAGVTAHGWAVFALIFLFVLSKLAEHCHKKKEEWLKRDSVGV